MSLPFLTPKARTLRSRVGSLDLAPRRIMQSWTRAEELGQPQDGALDLDTAPTSSPESVAAKRDQRDLREPEDASLTGGTRSLMRRVLGLNVTRPALKSLRTLPSVARKPALQ